MAELVREGAERLGGLPGIVSAGASVSMPLESDWLTSFLVIGRPRSASPPLASERIVSPTYFEVLGLRLLRGRSFGNLDRESSQPVAMINESMARQLWSQG